MSIIAGKTTGNFIFFIQKITNNKKLYYLYHSHISQSKLT